MTYGLNNPNNPRIRLWPPSDKSSGQTWHLPCLISSHGSVVSDRDVCKKASLPNSATGINTPAGRIRQGVMGFTLVEVVIAVLISTIVFATVVYAYVGANDRSEWSAYSFAAQSLA